MKLWSTSVPSTRARPMELFVHGSNLRFCPGTAMPPHEPRLVMKCWVWFWPLDPARPIVPLQFSQ